MALCLLAPGHIGTTYHVTLHAFSMIRTAPRCNFEIRLTPPHILREMIKTKRELKFGRYTRDKISGCKHDLTCRNSNGLLLAPLARCKQPRVHAHAGRAGKKRPGGEQQQQEREKGDRGKGTCFNCQEPGHESKDCPHEQACHQFVKNGNCRFGDDCKFAHPGAGGGRPRKREATEQDGRTREKRALPRSVQAMMKATAKIIALMENVGDEKKSFCLHRTLTGACKFDDAECSKVTGRSTLHALKEQCVGKVLDKFAETNEAKELLGTEGACFGLRKLAMKHVPDVIKLVDRQ